LFLDGTSVESSSAIAGQDLISPSSTVCVAVPPGAVAWWRAESNTVDSIGINDALPPGTRVSAALTQYMAGKVGAAFRLHASFSPVPTVNYLFVPPSPDLDVGAGEGLTI